MKQLLLRSIGGHYVLLGLFVVLALSLMTSPDAVAGPLVPPIGPP